MLQSFQIRWATPPPPTPSSPNLCPDFSREYCKPSVPLEERIEMVMSYMSVEDKMMTMGEQGITGKYKDGTNLAARSVSWWNEALHGVCRSCGDNGSKCPTQFPEANAMSTSFNATLWHMIGDTISTEGRGDYTPFCESVGYLADTLLLSCIVPKLCSLLQRRRLEWIDLLRTAT